MSFLILLGLTTGLALLYLYWSSRNITPLSDENALESALQASTRRSQWASHRGTFLHFGFVFALAFANLAFEYQTTLKSIVQKAEPLLSPILQVDAIRTAQKAEPLPPPPQPKKLTTELEKISLVDEVLEVDAPEFLEDLPIMDTSLPEGEQGVAVPPPPKPPAPKPQPEIKEVELPYDFVEQMPRYLGCELEAGTSELPTALEAEQKLLHFLNARLTYPSFAREIGVQGTAVISFVVEKDGSITGHKIVRDPGAGLGAEAMRVAKQLCAWAPGRQAGRRVRVQFNLPVLFRLE